MFTYLIPLASALATTITGAVVLDLMKQLLRHKPGQGQVGESYSSKIEKSLVNLKRASADIDSVMQEFTSISNERQERIKDLEVKLGQLTTKENELTSKIQTLEKVPIEIIKYFEDVIKKQETKVARRDYVLFALGAVVATVVTIVAEILLKKIGY